MKRWAVMLLALSSGACSSEKPPVHSGSTLDIVWSPCPVLTGGSDSAASCANVDVPLTWSDPGGAKTTLFLKRIRGDGGSRGQLWLLAGGPGHASDFFEPLLPLLTRTNDLDLYLVDHRGTGRSGRLGCPKQEAAGSDGDEEITPAELSACGASAKADFGHTLDHDRTTEAAHDVSALIDALREDGHPTLVYARSYGTYLAQRYLQIAPAGVDGVILDSTCSPTACTFPIAIDLAHDEIGGTLLDLCAADAGCAAKMPDPRQALSDLLDLLDSGHCNANAGARDGFKALLGTLLKDVSLRAVIPAVIHRLTLCRTQDLDALGHLGALLAALPVDPLDSPVTRDHIVYSELWREPTSADLTAIDHASITSGLTLDLSPSYADWPRYAPDDLVGALPSTRVPIMMLQGTLDPQTTLASAKPMRDSLTGAHQTYVEVPLSAHGVINSSLLASRDDTSCGALLIEQFLADPLASLDSSCTSDSRPIDFIGTPQVAQYLFGTADFWD